MFLNKKIITITTLIAITSASSAQALDLKKFMQKIQKSAQEGQQGSGQNTQPQPAGQHNTNSNQVTTTSSQQSNNNNYQNKNDPSRDAFKKQTAIRLAKKAGSPVSVSETVDGQERLMKEDVLTEALTKVVRSVHPDLGIPTYHHFRTYSEFQKNIANPKYGLINNIDKIEKENVFSIMGQPDPSKNTWSVTAKASVNTKLTNENIKAISDDQRIMYSQGFGNTAESARNMAALTAVQQYHQINLMNDSPIARNFMRNGLIQKTEIVIESLDKNSNLFVSKLKVTMTDLSTLDSAKFSNLKNEIEISKVREQPNPIMLALADAAKDVGSAQSIIENALSIKGSAEMIKQDASREKTGVRFGQNDFQWQVGMSADRWDVIQERLKDSPKLDEQQVQEFKHGQSAMIAASVKMFKSASSIFTSLSSGGNPFQALQTLISFPQMMAVNSDGINSLMTYNSNNGIDNSEMKVAKAEMGD